MKDYKKITIDSYNKTANEYYKKVITFDPLPELKIFIDLVRPKGNILDLGCGPGQHAKLFAQNGFSVTGIDLSEKMINIAKAKVPNALFFEMDILNFDLPKKTYNGIWASASLIHLKRSDISEVIINLKKLLKKNGILYVSIKEGNNEGFLIDGRYNDVKKFYTYYKKDELDKIFIKTGFKIIKKNYTDKRKIYDTNPWLHYFLKLSV